ncbi:serine/threonine-protein kinase [Burkholderiaceae bacterium UC74_6]
MSEKRGIWGRLFGKGSSEADSGNGPSGLARYQRERELGRGAMGEVWLATDLQTGQPVALKLLALSREFSPEDLADVRERFMREAHAARQLRHPDILQVLETGESGSDAWIVMEYVQGNDLSHFSRPGHLLPVAEALKIGARLGRALSHAHEQGVVHRDIKPANVMYDPTSGELRIMDFGIARMADGSRTRTGLVLGTPSFMSPEQLAGLTVDGRSDLYSLGVLLYQLLTGRLPHQSDSMAMLMQKIATAPPPDVRHYRPGLPESLAMVLALALEKRPELRYASGQQLAQDLEAVLDVGINEEAASLKGAKPDTPGAVDNAAPAAFAQTQRIELGEAVQNRAPPLPPKSNGT